MNHDQVWAVGVQNFSIVIVQKVLCIFKKSGPPMASEWKKGSKKFVWFNIILKCQVRL